MCKILVNEYFIKIIADSTDTLFLSFLLFANNNGILVDKQLARNTYHVSLRHLPEVLEQLRPGIDLSTAPELVKVKMNKEKIRRERTALLKQLGPDNAGHAFLWNHQQLGVELAEINDRYAFFYDTRTGKTLMSYQIMENALKQHSAKRILVVCPSAIIGSWLDDAKKFPGLKVAAYYGTEKKKKEALNTPCHIIIWSMELVCNTLDMLSTLKFDMCIVDESSKLKSYKSKISEALLCLSERIPRWYLLSATPAPNGEAEYYTQMRTIDPCIFSAFVTHFENKYFDNMSRSSAYKKLVIKPYLYDAFNALIEEYAIYVDQSVMPTAGKAWHDYMFEMPAEVKSTYDLMLSKMCIEAHGTTITVDMAAAMRAKLNQISSGFVMDTEAIKDNRLMQKVGLCLSGEEQQEIYIINDFRVEALRRLLEDIGNEKVVIWANYHAEFDMIEKLLGTKARYLRGGVSVQDKEAAFAEFKQGDLPYLVCHPLSVGMGINLAIAHNVIYYSMNDSWEAFKQSSERVAGHINVQPFEIQYYLMQAKDTVDTLILDNVRNKKDSSETFLSYLEAHYEQSNN